MKKREAGLQERPLFARLNSALIVSCSALALFGCAAAPGGKETGSGRFEFALIGDMPYDARQEKQFSNVMRQIDAAHLAFVVHNGDFQHDGAFWREEAGALPPCSDETLADRLRLAQASKHSFIFTPGDNDWTDCHRAKLRPSDPQERLSKLHAMFFQGDRSLGQRTIRLTRQSEDPRYAKFRENVRWSHGGVLFATLHLVGSNNNRGRTPEMDAEYAERNAANLSWLKEAFDQAKRSGARGVMIITQANPRFETTWPPVWQQLYMLGGLGLKSPEKRSATGFDDFLEALEEETLAFGKPVVLVHGNTHTFRIDKPLVGHASRRMIENFTRVETFGYPDTHWVRTTVDPSDPNVFSFRQEIVKENLVTHPSRWGP